MPSDFTTIVSARLPHQTVAKLDRRAHETGTSRSAILATAVEAELRKTAS